MVGNALDGRGKREMWEKWGARRDVRKKNDMEMLCCSGEDASTSKN